MWGGRWGEACPAAGCCHHSRLWLSGGQAGSVSGECGRGVWCGQQCPARTADWDRLCRPASLAAVYTPHCTVILCLLQPPPHMSSLYTSMSVIWSQHWLASIYMLSPDVMLCWEPGVCRSVGAPAPSLPPAHAHVNHHIYKYGRVPLSGFLR